MNLVKVPMNSSNPNLTVAVPYCPNLTNSKLTANEPFLTKPYS